MPGTSGNKQAVIDRGSRAPIAAIAQRRCHAARGSKERLQRRLYEMLDEHERADELSRTTPEEIAANCAG